MIRRFAQGLPLEGERLPLYDDDEGLPSGVDTRTMDLAEIESFLEDVKQRLEEAKVKLNDELLRPGREKKASEDATAAQEAAFQKELAHKRRLKKELEKAP